MSVALPQVREDSVQPRLQSGASGRPLKFTVRGHAMASTWHKIQTASKSYLWLSWATALWALTSYALIHSHLRLSHSLDLLTSLGRGFALFGGILAVLYVLIGARRPSLVVSGAAAAAINLWYCWDYVRSLTGLT
jgi:hypothetical protein